MPRHCENIIGNTYGRLFVVMKGVDHIQPSGKHMSKYICTCECGNIISVARQSLLNGRTRSCGCMRSERSVEVHTKYSDKVPKRLLKIYDKMKQRCYCVNNKSYSKWGARGIRICDEWLNDKSAFIDWALDNGYNDNLTIDRIDVNGNYEPSNCRWATAKVQANNRRNNRLVEYNNHIYTMSELSNLTGVPYSTLEARIDRYKWSIEKAVDNSKWK